MKAFLTNLETTRSTMKTRITTRLFLYSSVIALSLILSAPLNAANDDNAKPYDKKLFRLSEILGAVHYLRELCSSEDEMVWREKMQALINSEGTDAFRRVNLIKQFNKGYRSYRRTYRTCTNSARTAIDHFLTEGTKITEELAQNKW